MAADMRPAPAPVYTKAPMMAVAHVSHQRIDGGLPFGLPIRAKAAEDRS
jgi:hypothetical protein